MSSRPDPDRIHQLPVKIIYNLLPSHGRLIAYSHAPISCFVHPDLEAGLRPGTLEAHFLKSSIVGRRDKVTLRDRKGSRVGNGFVGREQEEEEEDDQGGVREEEGVEGVASLYLKGVASGVICASPELHPDRTLPAGSDHTIYTHHVHTRTSSSSSSAANTLRSRSSRSRTRADVVSSTGSGSDAFGSDVGVVPGLTRAMDSSEGIYSSGGSSGGFGSDSKALVSCGGVGYPLAYPFPFPYSYPYLYPYPSYPHGHLDNNAASSLPHHHHHNQQNPATYPYTHHPTTLPPLPIEKKVVVTSRGSLSAALDEPGYGTTLIRGRLIRSEEFASVCSSSVAGRGRRAGNTVRGGAGIGEGSRCGLRLGLGTGNGAGGLAALVEAEAAGRPDAHTEDQRMDGSSSSVLQEAELDPVEEGWGVEVIISLRRFDVASGSGFPTFVEVQSRSSSSSARVETTRMQDRRSSFAATATESVPRTDFVQRSSPLARQPLRKTHARTGSLLGQHPSSVPATGPSRVIRPRESVPVARTGQEPEHAIVKRLDTEPTKIPPLVKKTYKSKSSHVCSNCKVTESVTWRQRNGLKVCNACGIYWNVHRGMRPKELWDKPNPGRRVKKEPNAELSSDLGFTSAALDNEVDLAESTLALSTTTTTTEPLTSSFAPNLPLQHPPSPSKPISIFAHSRFHTQSLQSRKRARFEDQITVSIPAPLGGGSGGGVGGRSLLTARGLTASGFKRTLSTFAEGESAVRAAKRRATRGEIGLASCRSGGRREEGWIDTEERDDVAMASRSTRVEDFTASVPTEIARNGSGSQPSTLPSEVQIDDELCMLKPDPINFNLLPPSHSSPGPTLIAPIPTRPTFRSHDSFDVNALMNWDSSSAEDLEALFKLSQEQEPDLDQGPGQASYEVVQDQEGEVALAGSLVVPASREADSVIGGDMAFLRAMLAVQPHDDDAGLWAGEALVPNSAGYTTLKLATATPPFDFSPLPPSSPPLPIMDDFDLLPHRHIFLSSPGTSPSFAE